MKDESQAPGSDVEETEAQARFREYIEEAAREDAAGSHEAAMLAMMRAMEVAAEDMLNGDQPETERDRLFHRRVELEEKCDWPAVIEVQKELVRAAEEEAKREHPDAAPHFAPAVVCEPWRQLASIYNLVGDHATALGAVDQAVELARRSEMSPIITQTLSDRAHTLTLLGRWEEARDTAQEALSAIDLSLPFTDFLQARYQIQLARYEARTGRVKQARELLAKAEPILNRPQCQPDALRAAWHEVQAEILLAGGDSSGAIKELGAAVDFRKRAARSFMGGEEYASARTAITMKRLIEVQRLAGEESAATLTHLDLESLCQRFRFPMHTCR
jgi:tetratricopeptide (TPR) repeat protein